MDRYRGEHPTEEILAAMVDGRLTGKERREVVEHLDACPDCYEVFAETVRFQEEDAPRGRVVPAAGRWGTRRYRIAAAAAAAAALVVAIALATLWVDVDEPGGAPAVVADLPAAGALVAALADPRAAAGRLPTPSSVLGFAPGARELAFRAGTALSDLYAAAAAHDGPGAEEASSELSDLAAGVPGAGEPLAAVRSALDSRSWSDLAAATRRLEAALAAAPEPDHLLLGSWAATGYRAATSEDVAFFSSSAFRNTLADLEAGGALDRPAADRIRELTDDGRAAPADLPALAQAFEALSPNGG